MKPQLSREEFLVLLSSAIPDAEMREQIIHAAKALIPGEAALKKLKALTSKQFYNAQLAYRKLHPDCERGHPDLIELITWLMGEGAVNRALDMENRLTKIHEVLMNSGMIDQETPISMSFIDMLYSRYLSNIDQHA